MLQDAQQGIWRLTAPGDAHKEAAAAAEAGREPKMDVTKESDNACATGRGGRVASRLPDRRGVCTTLKDPDDSGQGESGMCPDAPCGEAPSVSIVTVAWAAAWGATSSFAAASAHIGGGLCVSPEVGILLKLCVLSCAGDWGAVAAAEAGREPKMDVTKESDNACATGRGGRVASRLPDRRGVCTTLKDPDDSGRGESGMCPDAPCGEAPSVSFVTVAWAAAWAATSSFAAASSHIVHCAMLLEIEGSPCDSEWSKEGLRWREAP